MPSYIPWQNSLIQNALLKKGILNKGILARDVGGHFLRAKGHFHQIDKSQFFPFSEFSPMTKCPFPFPALIIFRAGILPGAARWLRWLHCIMQGSRDQHYTGTALNTTARHCMYCTALHCTWLHLTDCKALQCSALHWTALHCIALHCTALHCTALHCSALHCIAQHCTALHCTALHCTALHCTALHRTALHCTALHCTALHCTHHCLGAPFLSLGAPLSTGATLSSFYLFVVLGLLLYLFPAFIWW